MDFMHHIGEIALATIPRRHVVLVMTVVTGLDLGVTTAMSNPADTITMAGIAGRGRGNIGTRGCQAGGRGTGLKIIGSVDRVDDINTFRSTAARAKGDPEHIGVGGSIQRSDQIPIRIGEGIGIVTGSPVMHDQQPGNIFIGNTVGPF